MRKFGELTAQAWGAEKFLCVGIDLELGSIPKRYGSSPRKAFEDFARDIVDQTKKIAGAYKINVAFYEPFVFGTNFVSELVSFINAEAPHVPVIIDGKRNDIGKTAAAYDCAMFDKLGADATTINPYLGEEACRPFLDRKHAGIIALCKTSNLGSGEFQNRRVYVEEKEREALGVEVPYVLLYELVAWRVAKKWQHLCDMLGLVVGATHPRELSRVREIVGDETLILVPGIGTQGGDLARSIEACRLTENRRGVLFNVSSGISGAESPGTAARGYHEAILREIGAHT